MDLLTKKLQLKNPALTVWNCGTGSGSKNIEEDTVRNRTNLQCTFQF